MNMGKVFKNRYSKMEKEYIENIVKMVSGCNDVALLDLIFQLLKKEGYANTK